MRFYGLTLALSAAVLGACAGGDQSNTDTVAVATDTAAVAAAAPAPAPAGAPAAAGIALVVTIANVGGFVGPTIIGAMKDRFGTHGPAFMLLGGCAIVGALLATLLRNTEAFKR